MGAGLVRAHVRRHAALDQPLEEGVASEVLDQLSELPVVGADAEIGPDVFVRDSIIGSGSRIWYAVLRNAPAVDGDAYVVRGDTDADTISDTILGSPQTSVIQPISPSEASVSRAGRAARNGPGTGKRIPRPRRHGPAGRR